MPTSFQLGKFRRNIIVFSAMGTLVVACVTALVASVPLYLQMIEARHNALSFDKLTPFTQKALADALAGNK